MNRSVMMSLILIFLASQNINAQSGIDKNEALEFVRKCLITFDSGGDKNIGYSSFERVGFDNTLNELILYSTYEGVEYTRHIVLAKVDVSSIYITNVNNNYYLCFVVSNGVYGMKGKKLIETANEFQFDGYCADEQASLPKKFLRAFKDLCIACGAPNKTSKYDSEP